MRDGDASKSRLDTKRFRRPLFDPCLAIPAQHFPSVPHRSKHPFCALFFPFHLTQHSPFILIERCFLFLTEGENFSLDDPNAAMMLYHRFLSLYFFTFAIAFLTFFAGSRTYLPHFQKTLSILKLTSALENGIIILKRQG